MEALLERHTKEVNELKETSKAMLKAAKKSERVATETKVVQMEFDLKAKHREEVDQLEEELGNYLSDDRTNNFKNRYHAIFK